MRKALVVSVVAGFLFSVPSLAADLEARVTRIENILNNQRNSDLLLQIQRLQAEIQLLRGTVEQQQFDLEQLKRQQKDQYVDLDARLRGREDGPPAASPAPASGPSNPADAMRTPRPPSGDGGGVVVPSSDSAGLSLELSEAARPAGEKEAYRDAFDLLKKRRYDAAVVAFNDLLKRWPNGELADNAHYWLGEAHYVKRDFPAAVKQFRTVLDDYPLSPKVAGSMLKIGYIQGEQKEWGKARSTLEELVRKFPGSTEARLANGRLERLARDGR
jgi:tol-pal system protein YbgF